MRTTGALSKSATAVWFTHPPPTSPYIPVVHSVAINPKPPPSPILVPR